MVTDGFSAEKATANSAEMRAIQAGDVSYKEESAAAAARARVELDGVSAEKSIAAARVFFLFIFQSIHFFFLHDYYHQKSIYFYIITIASSQKFLITCRKVGSIISLARN